LKDQLFSVYTEVVDFDGLVDTEVVVNIVLFSIGCIEVEVIFVNSKVVGSDVVSRNSILLSLI